MKRSLTFDNSIENFFFNWYNVIKRFYSNRFFKDRHWLFTEFEELSPKSSGQESPGLVQINGGEANELEFPGQNAHTRFFEVCVLRILLNCLAHCLHLLEFTHIRFPILLDDHFPDRYNTHFTC